MIPFLISLELALLLILAIVVTGGLIFIAMGAIVIAFIKGGKSE